MTTYTKPKYPDRVTRDTDNVYRWCGKFDRAEKLLNIRIPLYVSGGLCILFLVMALVIDREMLPVMLLITASVMAVTGLVCALYWHFAGEVFQPYEMTEEHIRYVGSVKTDTVIPFQRIRSAVFSETRNQIRVRGLLVTFPVFIPAEDYRFVENYIRRRLPDTASVTFR